MSVFALLKILPTHTLQRLLFEALEYFVARTENKLDDELVKIVKDQFNSTQPSP
jgi:hypothetical protein